MILNVQYFGMIAEKIACESEKMTVEKSILLSDFKIDLVKKYPVLKNQNYQIAVNQELENDDFKIESDSDIALLPPFAGG